MSIGKSPYLKIKPVLDEHQLWLVIDSKHERHLYTSHDKFKVWDLAMQIKTAGIELEEDCDRTQRT